MMKELGISKGDVISINGGRETFSIVDKAYSADVGESIIRIDGLIRKNANIDVGEEVIVRKVNAVPAKRVSIAPAQKGLMVQADSEIFKKGLLGRAVTKGDVIAFSGTQGKRDLMSEGFPDIFGDLQDIFGSKFGFAGFEHMRFLIVSTTPNQPCIIKESTELILNSRAIEKPIQRISEFYKQVPPNKMIHIKKLPDNIKDYYEVKNLEELFKLYNQGILINKFEDNEKIILIISNYY